MNNHQHEEAWGPEGGRSPSGVPHGKGEEPEGEGTWHELKEEEDTVTTGPGNGPVTM